MKENNRLAVRIAQYAFLIPFYNFNFALNLANACFFAIILSVSLANFHGADPWHLVSVASMAATSSSIGYLVVYVVNDFIDFQKDKSGGRSKKSLPHFNPTLRNAGFASYAAWLIAGTFFFREYHLAGAWILYAGILVAVALVHSTWFRAKPLTILAERGLRILFVGAVIGKLLEIDPLALYPGLLTGLPLYLRRSYLSYISYKMPALQHYSEALPGLSVAMAIVTLIPLSLFDTAYVVPNMVTLLAISVGSFFRDGFGDALIPVLRRIAGSGLDDRQVHDLAATAAEAICCVLAILFLIF